MSPQVLLEAEVDRDLSLLDRAWEAPATFALSPVKGAVAPALLAEWLGRLPAGLQEGHFGLLTSGSTGQPKLVVGERARAERLARHIHAAQEGEAARGTVLALPPSYSYAFVNQWLWARVHGRALVPTRGFAEPDRLREVLRGARDAMLCLVGGQVPLLDQLGEEAFPGVVRLHFAGGPFPQQRLPALRARFPSARIFNNYGCAEAMPRLAIRPAEQSDEACVVGRPLPGVELRSGEGAELSFRSATGAVGWVDDAGFHPIGPGEWVPTGDLGRERPDGAWELLGRGGEVFKRYGEKVSLPLLLATVHGAWPREAAFYRQRDRAGEEGAVLVLAPRPAEADLRAVLRALRAHHPRPHWPLRLEAAEALPLLANGKVDARALEALPGKTVLWDQRL